MSFEAYPTRDTEQDVRHHLVRMVGTGASAPTRIIGKGIAITRDDVGVYTLTWASNPGAWIGPPAPGLQATTSANVRGCSVTWGVFDTTTFAVQFKVWDGLAQAAGVWVARELDALEWLGFSIPFKLTGP